MDLQFFNRKKELIKQNYQRLFDAAETLNANDLGKSITDTLKSLEHDHFNIVVVGEFSRGKSTFINALLGQRVLPSATKPTTTVINKISAGDKIEYILHFRDHEQTLSLSEEAFKELVAPIEPDFDDEEEIKKYNDSLKYISTISYASIKYPTKLLKDGVEIIDTPGTNDMDQAREEITFTFIPQSDAAILVLSATQILSDSEVTFLKERILANDIHKVFFVINAKDKLRSMEDEKKVFDYAHKHLKEYVEKPKIFLVSSRSALNYKRNANGETVKGAIPGDLSETGFAVLEQEISDYLINERGKIKLTKYYNRGMKIATEMIDSHIKLNLSTVDLSLRELEQKVNELVPKVKDTQHQALQVLNQLKASLKGLENDYVYMYRTGLDGIALRANIAVNNYDGPLEVENIARYVEQTVAPMQRELDKDIKDFKQRFIDSEINEAAIKLGKILDNLNFTVENQLVVANTSVGFTKSYQPISVQKSETLSPGEGIFGGLLVGGAAFLLFSAPFIVIPAAMFGGKYLETMLQTKKRNNFIAEVKIQVERRYGEIIPKQVESFQKNYNQAISQSITMLEAKMNQKINSLEEQLNKLVNEKKQAKMDVDHEIAGLKKLQKQLEVIITEFERELA